MPLSVAEQKSRLITTAHLDSKKKLSRAPNALHGLSRRGEQRIRQPIGPPPKTPEARLHSSAPAARTVGSGRGEVDRGVRCGVSDVQSSVRHSHCTMFRDLSSCRNTESACPSLGTPQTTHESGSHPEVPILPTLATPAWVTDRPLPCRPRDISALERNLSNSPAVRSVLFRSRLLCPYAMS